MSLNDIPLTTLDGRPASLADYADGAVPVVNVASKCGLTPQYAALEKLAEDYRERGLSVIGVPAELVQTADADGDAGDVQWNVEKFLLAPGGEIVGRFRPRTEPGAPQVISAIEAVLPH